MTMAVEIRCKDVGFNCDGVITAHTEEEAIKMAADHAKSVHGLQNITPEVATKVKAAIRRIPDA